MSELNSCICDSHLAPPKSMPDVDARIKVTREILATCEIVKRGDWRTLDQCRICGRYWVVEAPYCERHGCGPLCAYHVDGPEFPDKYLTGDLRSRADDLAIIERLGPESGPARCAKPGCGRLTVSMSVLCAVHHFEQIKGRAPDFTVSDTDPDADGVRP